MESRRGNVVRLPQLEHGAPFRPRYVSELQGREPAPVSFIVDGCIPRGAVTLLAGQPDVGKSYLAQQLLTAVATGHDWLGRQVERCRTFGLFAEDSDQIFHVRQERISRHYGIEHGDLELDVAWLSRDGGNTTLLSFGRWDTTGAPSALWERQLVPFLFDAGVQLVVIDNARRVFRGNENDANQVASFIEMLTRLAVALDGAVVLPAHPPKAGNSYFSGSGAWEGAVRAAMSLERPRHYDEYSQEPYDERVLWMRKSNWAGRRPPIPLRFVDGVFVAEELKEAKRSLSQIEKTDLDYRLLNGLRRLIENGARVTADPDAAGSLPHRAKRSTPEFRDWPLIWFSDSVDRLLADNRIVRVEVGGRIVIRPSDMRLPGEKDCAPI